MAKDANEICGLMKMKMNENFFNENFSKFAVNEKKNFLRSKSAKVEYVRVAKSLV